MSLPAGPMISLTAALEGVCTLWPRGGEPRQVPVVDFVTGNHAERPRAGRAAAVDPPARPRAPQDVRLPAVHAHAPRPVRGAASSAPCCPEHGEFLLTITAATLRPVQLRFEAVPDAAELRRAIDDAAPPDLYLDDAHGSPAHRRHLTHYFGEQIRSELSR